MSTSLFDLAGRVAVVVGGTSGIGRTIALGLARAGADVVATGRRQELVESAAADIRSAGRRTLSMVADVADLASLERLRDATVKELGTVDIVVAAAGTIKRLPSLEMPDAVWQQIVDTNLTGTLRTCQVFGAHMVKAGYGRVITIASLNSFIGMFEVAAYAATKSGVAGLTRALAVEWAPRGVNVNAIAPGVFRTDMNTKLLDTPRGHELLARTPLRRFGRLDELVGAAIFLASEASSFVTGQLLVVDGGFLASGVNQ